MKLSSKMYDKFTVANNIEKLTEPIFVKDHQYDWYIRSKKRIYHNPCPDYLVEPYEALIQNFINKETGSIHWNLYDTVMKLQEDIAVIFVENKSDFLAYVHVSFPSGWCPEQRIGQSFAKLHKDVPGFVFNPTLMQTLLRGRYQRFVWSPIYENSLNQHPGQSRKFTIDNPKFWLKIEKQITIGFPATGCFLFVMRQYIYDENEVDLRVFCDTIRSMSPLQKTYKGITAEFEEWLNEKV